MSAHAIAAPQVHYKDQMKMMRAETATSWTLAAVKWIADALTQPLSTEHDVGNAPRRRDFPAFHC
jgi:hypothetical protein